jgi:hypothetical protein
MEFKSWIEATVLDKSEEFFTRRDKNATIDVASALGLKAPLKLINRGSVANIYQHPFNPSQIIKVTGHKKDVQNLWKAQNLNSPNIVKVYGPPKQIGPTAYAIIADKIIGPSMPYDTNSFIYLIQGEGQGLEFAADDIYDDESKAEILKAYGRNTDEEKIKLSFLFRTLYQLEKIYRISLTDFDKNIIDSGENYVIVDMGF